MSWATRYIGRTDMHCWALVRDVYARHCGVPLPAYGEVDARELQAVAAAVAVGTTYHETWQPVLPFPGAEREYDVVVMKGWLPCADGVKRRGVVHTGLITIPGYVLHTDHDYAIVHVPLNHPLVRRRIVACYRHVQNA